MAKRNANSRRRGLPAAAIAVLGIASLATGTAQDKTQIAVREGVARNVYITATDSDGARAKGLTPQDVSIREDGETREVLSVAPATETMQIAMLVDDSGPGIQHIRVGVGEFIQVLRNDAEIAIVSTAGQNVVVVDFTRDYGALINGVRGLVTRTTSGGYLLDGMHEAARTLQRRAAARPVIVVLAIEGTEFSNITANRVLEGIRLSGAVVHVLNVGKPALKTMSPLAQRPSQSLHDSLDETITRGTVMVEAPRRSGGRFEQLVEFSGVPLRLSEIARDLRDQLVVTYARPRSAKGARKIDVSIKRGGIKLRAPKHIS